MLLLLFILVGEVISLPENNACEHLYEYPIKSYSGSCFVNQNVFATTTAMITQKGYRVLSYNVTTPDGYILELFRIPPAVDDHRKNKQPVFLQHGLFHDSGSWTFVGNRSLAFKLADRGYDVWLGNQRGTRYSRRNLHLNSSCFNFWNYSLDTLAANDIPTFLNKVANVTEQAGNIIYVGHSRGTTLVFMFASEFPEEAQRLLKGIVAFSPIVYFDMIWYVERAMTLLPSLGKILLGARISAIFYHTKQMFEFFFNFCSEFPYVCMLIIDVTSGVTWQFLSEDLLVYYTHSPSTESVILILQYAQIALSGRFQKYDFGQNKNLKIYNQTNPPFYGLEKITVPVYMFYGENDIFIKRESVRKIYEQINNPRNWFSKIPVHQNNCVDQFSHNDFLWAKNLDTLLYPTLFDILETELRSN